MFGTAETDPATDVQSFQQKTPEIDRRFWENINPSIIFLTPSVWSAGLLHTAGLPLSQLRVLPHGFNADLFYPVSSRTAKAALRTSFGWHHDDCVVVVTVGHMRWKKGIDALLPAAVAAARGMRDGECMRLVLKGLDELYESSAKVEELLDAGVEQAAVAGGKARVGAPLRAAARKLFKKGKLILDVRGETMPTKQVADLMRAADVFVSPYRAEGFNLPVLEAAAVGLPLIVSEGGAADAFTHASFTRFVTTKLIHGGPAGNNPNAAHVEPDRGDLADALIAAVRDKAWRERSGPAAAAWVRANNFTWDSVARRHVSLFFPEKAAAAASRDVADEYFDDDEEDDL